MDPEFIKDTWNHAKEAMMKPSIWKAKAAKSGASGGEEEAIPMTAVMEAYQFLISQKSDSRALL